MSQLKRLICCFLVFTTPLAVAHPLWVVTEVTPPLQSIEGEQVTGETTTTVRNILQQLQLQADFYAYPWARSYKLALERPNTLIYPLARTPEREGDFIWLQKILSLELQFVALKHQALTLNKLAEAKAYVTGVGRGDLAHQTLLKLGFEQGQNLLLKAGFVELVELLYAGKVDLIVADMHRLKLLAAELGKPVDELVAVYPFPVNPEFYLAAQKDTEWRYIRAFQQKQTSAD